MSLATDLATNSATNSAIEMPLSRAHKYIPNGCQTLSKRNCVYPAIYPKFLVSGHGCEVVGDNDKTYIDFISALGAILLGYNNPAVDDAVKETINSGEVLLSLPHPKEGELAEKLCQMVGLDQIKFFKTGSEATSAAVRVARAATGKEQVLVCGYNGWHDWAAITYDRPAGVPAGNKLTTKKFQYNDLDSVARLLKTGEVAGIIMEPMIYEFPAKGFLENLAAMAKSQGVLLIFDEIVTGLRFGKTGAAGMFKIKPDLICMGKAAGNGYPISILGGHRQYMAVFERDDFIASGTFSGDLVGISAALATLEQLNDVKIWSAGAILKAGFNQIVADLGLESIECIGYSPRTKFNFPTEAHRYLFWQECAKQGILFGYANFPTQSHGPIVMNKVLRACEIALNVVKDVWQCPEKRLEGELPKSAVVR